MTIYNPIFKAFIGEVHARARILLALPSRWLFSVLLLGMSSWAGAESLTNSGSPTSNTFFEVYAHDVRPATQVHFATWTSPDQDGRIWYPGSYDASTNRWKIRVDKSNHNNEDGLYIIHAYGVDLNGTLFWVDATTVTVTPPLPPGADSITNSGTPTSAASFEVYANNVRGVAYVVFPTWTHAGGQDDLVWHPGEYDPSNNRWKTVIAKSAHRNEIDHYIVHVYGVDANNNPVLFGGTIVTLIDAPPPPPPLPLLRQDRPRTT